MGRAMKSFMGLEVGPGIDWRALVHRRMVEGAGLDQKDDPGPFSFFHHLMEHHPELRGEVTGAMAGLLEDEDPVLRATAVMFLEDYPQAGLADRLLGVARDCRSLYESVDNPLRPGEPLVLGLLSALAENAEGHVATAEFMRGLLSDPKYAYKAFSYLLDVDVAGLLTQLRTVLTPENDMSRFMLQILLMRVGKDRFAEVAQHLKPLAPDLKKAALEIMHNFGLDPGQEKRVEALLR
jgi:hypothetical protein